MAKRIGDAGRAEGAGGGMGPRAARTFPLELTRVVSNWSPVFHEFSAFHTRSVGDLSMAPDPAAQICTTQNDKETQRDRQKKVRSRKT